MKLVNEGDIIICNNRSETDDVINALKTYHYIPFNIKALNKLSHIKIHENNRFTNGSLDSDRFEISYESFMKRINSISSSTSVSPTTSLSDDAYYLS